MKIDTEDKQKSYANESRNEWKTLTYEQLYSKRIWNVWVLKLSSFISVSESTYLNPAIMHVKDM